MPSLHNTECSFVAAGRGMIGSSVQFLQGPALAPQESALANAKIGVAAPQNLQMGQGSPTFL